MTAAVPSTDQPSHRPSGRRPRRASGRASGRASLASTLRDLRASHSDDAADPQLGDIMKALGRHGPSLSLALVSLPSLIPSPGIPVGSLFGSVAALICLALVLGRPVALPDSLGKRRLPRRLWIGMLDRMVPLAERLERRLQPRLRQITGRLGHRLVGAIGFVLAVLIVLPIPFGNTLPAIATICLALGLAQRDGMAVASGFALSLLALGASLLLALFGVELAATLWSWLDLDLF